VLGRLFNDKTKNNAVERARKRLTTLTPDSTFTEHTKDFWIEAIAEDPAPRIYILHNIATAEECTHLVELGTKRYVHVPLPAWLALVYIAVLVYLQCV
jgi:hypothetical protein